MKATPSKTRPSVLRANRERLRVDEIERMDRAGRGGGFKPGCFAVAHGGVKRQVDGSGELAARVRPSS
jgi:hypothetical protein